MQVSSRKFTWTSTGCALAFVSGSLAFADDTELLLVNPDPASNPKPNVMFILDTSSSMATREMTNEPYDFRDPNNGACETDKLYWSEVDVLPVCGGSNTRYVAKSAYLCDYSINQIKGIGSYTDTMVQYRSGGPGPANWQQLEPGNHSGAVECWRDRGVHGDGTTGYVYANSTTGGSEFTNVAANEISWGSPPRNSAYTVYDGKYLNWKASPATVTLSRSTIMKEVIKKVLSSVNNLNVGLMRFNNKEGGPVILGITDLDSNRTAVMNAINSLPADGATPLTEVMYENALYWRGMPAHYGQLIHETPTNPNALASNSPKVYRQPTLDVCAKNYNVLLTDGDPNNNEGEQTLIPGLPNFANALGRNTCDAFTTDGDCLDDVAEYLSVEDIDSATAGIQNVTTHTIGFTIDLKIMEDTAFDSGGQYFLADDVESLTKTLLSIIANINDRGNFIFSPCCVGQHI